MVKRNKKYYFLLLLLILIIALLFHVFLQKNVAIGAWTEGLFDSNTQTLHPEKLQDLEKTIHKKFSIAHFYRGWDSLTDPTLINQLDILKSNSWEPMLNVNPYYFSDCPKINIPLYQAIAEGKCDEFLHKAGQNLRNVRTPFYLLFAWEMNNKDLAWNANYPGGARDFVSAWRHIHTIFKEENTINVIWVFCPNTHDSTGPSYDELYPGDDYVQWVCIDGYNWGTTQSWSRWQSFGEVFTSSYNHLIRIAPNKPMMIGEVNSANDGGDKSFWYNDMFTIQIPYKFPNIKAVVIYNEDRSKSEHVNWNVDITPASLEAFIKGIHTWIYR